MLSHCNQHPFRDTHEVLVHHAQEVVRMPKLHTKQDKLLEEMPIEKDDCLCNSWYQYDPTIKPICDLYHSIEVFLN